MGSAVPSYHFSRIAAMKNRHRNLPVLPCAVILIALLVSCASAPKPEKTNTLPDEMGAFLQSHGMPKFEATTPKLYFSSEEWRSRVLELIDQAHDYILVSSFLTNSHPVNVDIFEALATKARQGVKVYVMFDSSSYFTTMPDRKSYLPTPLKYFEHTPVHVAEYNSIAGTKLYALPSLLNRDHRKFWIVDGKYLAAGGINLNYYSFAPIGELSNIDTFIELQSAGAVSEMVHSFCETWNRYSAEEISANSFQIRDSQTETSIWLADQTLDDGSQVDALFDAFSLYAKKELWMVQAYTFTTPALVKKIETATRRGVTVNVMLSANAFQSSYDRAAKYCIKDLLEAGANVFMFDSPDKSFLHYKLLLADGRFAAFGSPNFNLRSQYLSREIAIITDDAGVGNLAYENVQELLKHAAPVSMEEARRYRGLEYFVAYVGLLFGG